MGNIGVPVSIDTYKAATAEAALSAGASIVNDVWGFTRDPDIIKVTAAHGAAGIIGHWEPDLADEPDERVIPRINDFFSRQIDKAMSAGIAEAKITLDPGIGFGKTPAQNLVILNGLQEIRALGFPGAGRRLAQTLHRRDHRPRPAGAACRNPGGPPRRRAQRRGGHPRPRRRGPP